ncbi:MAG: YkgJ family cysteine cluster protein [Deltaproteobacteria bacterium]|nr:YkgJ family cysteine cluster protein [Deltaproteobacteria bacterium]
MTDELVPDCPSCEEHCCEGEGSDIRLRLLDLAYLKDADLLDELYVSTMDSDHDKDQHLLSERLFPKLKRNEDGTCVFFNDGECAIYEIRPLRCQRFPYRLHDDKSGISYATRCQSRKKGTQEEHRRLRSAVVENYNEKLKDLITLTHRAKDNEDIFGELQLESWVSTSSLRASKRWTR